MFRKLREQQDRASSAKPDLENEIKQVNSYFDQASASKAKGTERVKLKESLNTGNKTQHPEYAFTEIKPLLAKSVRPKSAVNVGSRSL